MSGDSGKIIANIRHEMDRLNWKPMDLARASGIAQPQISRYMKGINKPTTVQLQKIADALGVTLSVVIGDQAPSDSPYRKPTPEEMALHIFDSLGLEGPRGDLIKLLLEKDKINFSFFLEVIQKSLTSDAANDEAESTG